MEVVYGVDTRKSTIEDWNGSYTGYYLRKYIDPNNDAQYVRQSISWRFMRYAEVLLNYAEACIELGLDQEAKTYMNMIRKRAGMPDITETGLALKINIEMKEEWNWPLRNIASLMFDVG